MNNGVLVWIDLEMTGLDPAKDTILEIATIITDSNLAIIAQGPSLVIHQADAVLDRMEPIVRNLHARSGLTEAVKQSHVSLAEAEQQTFEFIKQHARKNEAYLAGNSVWQDRSFLVAYMPSIVNYLHYRLLDVSSFKLAINMWYPHEKNAMGYKKQDKHRALDDIKESIEELKFYRDNFF